jgi:hypothetical protein
MGSSHVSLVLSGMAGPGASADGLVMNAINWSGVFVIRPAI